MTVPSDPFGRTRLPHDFSRQDRVFLLGEAAHALLSGQLPSTEARLFLAAGLLAWLENGGDLLRDLWRVKAPAGSHHTPNHVWCSSRGATPDAKTNTIQHHDFNEDTTP